MAKERALSEKSLEAYEALKASEKALTLAELKEKVADLNSSNLTALVNRDLVSAEKVEVEVVTVVKRKVNAYKVVEATEEATEEETE